MREIINHPTYGEIIYTESFWSGKKTLTVNGINAVKVSKKEFSLNGLQIVLQGNILKGVTIQINGEVIGLIAKPKWYEMVLAMLPFLLLVTWGNNPVLCAKIPVVGGAIGGAIGGAFMCVSLNYIKKATSPAIKILIGLGASVLTLLASHILAITLLGVLN